MFPITHRLPLRGVTVVLSLIVLASILSPVAFAQEVPELQINSERYILIDAESGEVYAQRGANDEVAIASLTKIFTAVQALNMAPLDMEITTKEFDLQPGDATIMGFGPGETYTLQDLIYGMMLPSGNDAAWAIARSLGYQEGDTDEEAAQRFIDLMNQRIANMGLENTHLENPDGWGVPGHYSSAADVAAFMQYAMEYPFLVEVMGTHSYTTSNGWITVSNTNRLLNTSAMVIGGKTGFDNDSGWCLVNIAASGDSYMIAVTLDGIAPGDWYDDNRVLLEYGFNRKAELASSNQAFNGDIVGYLNPDAAQLASIGSTAATISGQQQHTGEFDPPDSSGQIVESGRSGVDLAAPGPWLGALAALAIVGFRGAISWRDLGGAFSMSQRQTGRERAQPGNPDTPSGTDSD